MVKKIFTLLLVVVFLMSSATVFAMGKKCNKGGMDDKVYKKMHLAMVNAEELGLSDEQLEQIKDLKIKTKKKMIKYDASIKILAVDIKAELWNDKIDVAKTDMYIDEKYNIKKKKTKALVSAIADFKGILTEDQNKKMKGICLKSYGKK